MWTSGRRLFEVLYVLMWWWSSVSGRGAEASAWLDPGGLWYWGRVPPAVALYALLTLVLLALAGAGACLRVGRAS